MEDRELTAEARQAAAVAVRTLLLSKAALLGEYFGVEIVAGSEDGVAVLQALPRLLDGHSPYLVHLPEFIMSLAYDVQWEAEKPCFQTVAAVLAEFYARLPPVPPPTRSTEEERSADDAVMAALRADRSSTLWIAEHVLFRAFRRSLQPSAALARDHHVVQLACTSQLYRVFERC